MGESQVSPIPNPSSLPSPPPSLPSSATPLPLPEAPNSVGFFSSFHRPALRVTSEFDSDSSVFFHKVSCKFFDSLAKLKLSFQNNRNGEVFSPQLCFITKNLSLLYDFEAQDALVKGSFNVGNHLQFRASRAMKEEQGEVAMIAKFHDPSYELELSSSLPLTILPRVTCRFPRGEISMESADGDAKYGVVGPVSLMLKGEVMNGTWSAFGVSGKESEMRLRYAYKDEEMAFIPTLSFPSNALSFAFKRRFSSMDKLSYWYHFNSKDWSAVYKRAVGKDLKFKAGYDSDVRLGWASLWVGQEGGKVKAAPMKMKVQVMLQVPQDDLANSVVLFMVKKRWDF